MAVTLHVLLLVVLIHGVKTERKSMLMPYIVYAAITVLTGLVGVYLDLYRVLNKNLWDYSKIYYYLK